MKSKAVVVSAVLEYIVYREMAVRSCRYGYCHVVVKQRGALILLVPC